MIVTYRSATELRRSVPALLSELDEADELIFVDNSPGEETALAIKDLAPEARLIRSGGNVGFARAANLGAETAAGDLIVLLNPDAKPMPGFGAAIRRPHIEGRGWDAWMALVLCEHATAVNSRGNRVHFTGFSWAGGHGEPVPGAISARQIPAASGACMAVPRDVWNRHGGFAEQFFLYCEDTDLSLRIRLFGGAVGLEPTALVDHQYEFGGRTEKWRWLERNRWAFVVRTYPTPVLVAVLPVMLLTELAVIAVGLRDGWWRQKLAAISDLRRWLPRLLVEREAIQARREISAADFARQLTAELDSPFFGPIGRNPVVRACLGGYWWLVRRLIGLAGRHRP